MKGEHILYPCYFDLDLPRARGRRIPRGLAVKGPAVGDIERAARKIGVPCRVEKKHHPAHWYTHTGRLVVSWPGTKAALVRKIAHAMERKR